MESKEKVEKEVSIPKPEDDFNSVERSLAKFMWEEDQNEFNKVSGGNLVVTWEESSRDTKTVFLNLARKVMHKYVKWCQEPEDEMGIHLMNFMTHYDLHKKDIIPMVEKILKTIEEI